MRDWVFRMGRWSRWMTMMMMRERRKRTWRDVLTFLSAQRLAYLSVQSDTTKEVDRRGGETNLNLTRLNGSVSSYNGYCGGGADGQGDHRGSGEVETRMDIPATFYGVSGVVTLGWVTWSHESKRGNKDQWQRTGFGDEARERGCCGHARDPVPSPLQVPLSRSAAVWGPRSTS